METVQNALSSIHSKKGARGAQLPPPSVGLSQPWDFHVVRRPERLRAFAEHVAGCRCDFADSLPDGRRDTFNPIRIEGIVESGTGVVVTYDPTRGGPNILGRHTIDYKAEFIICTQTFKLGGRRIITVNRNKSKAPAGIDITGPDSSTVGSDQFDFCTRRNRFAIENQFMRINIDPLP